MYSTTIISAHKTKNKHSIKTCCQSQCLHNSCRSLKSSDWAWLCLWYSRPIYGWILASCTLTFRLCFRYLWLLLLVPLLLRVFHERGRGGDRLAGPWPQDVVDLRDILEKSLSHGRGGLPGWVGHHDGEVGGSGTGISVDVADDAVEFWQVVLSPLQVGVDSLDKKLETSVTFQ